MLQSIKMGEYEHLRCLSPGCQQAELKVEELEVLLLSKEPQFLGQRKVPVLMDVVADVDAVNEAFSILPKNSVIPSGSAVQDRGPR